MQKVGMNSGCILNKIEWLMKVAEYRKEIWYLVNNCQQGWVVQNTVNLTQSQCRFLIQFYSSEMGFFLVFVVVVVSISFELY